MPPKTTGQTNDNSLIASSSQAGPSNDAQMVVTTREHANDPQNPPENSAEEVLLELQTLQLQALHLLQWLDQSHAHPYSNKPWDLQRQRKEQQEWMALQKEPLPLWDHLQKLQQLHGMHYQTTWNDRSTLESDRIIKEMTGKSVTSSLERQLKPYLKHLLRELPEPLPRAVSADGLAGVQSEQLCKDTRRLQLLQLQLQQELQVLQLLLSHPEFHTDALLQRQQELQNLMLRHLQQHQGLWKQSRHLMEAGKDFFEHKKEYLEIDLRALLLRGEQLKELEILLQQKEPLEWSEWLQNQVRQELQVIQFLLSSPNIQKTELLQRQQQIQQLALRHQQEWDQQSGGPMQEVTYLQPNGYYTIVPSLRKKQLEEWEALLLNPPLAQILQQQPVLKQSSLQTALPSTLQQQRRTLQELFPQERLQFRLLGGLYPSTGLDYELRRRQEDQMLALQQKQPRSLALDLREMQELQQQHIKEWYEFCQLSVRHWEFDNEQAIVRRHGHDHWSADEASKIRSLVEIRRPQLPGLLNEIHDDKPVPKDEAKWRQKRLLQTRNDRSYFSRITEQQLIFIHELQRLHLLLQHQWLLRRSEVQALPERRQQILEWQQAMAVRFEQFTSQVSTKRRPTVVFDQLYEKFDYDFPADLKIAEQESADRVKRGRRIEALGEYLRDERESDTLRAKWKEELTTLLQQPVASPLPDHFMERSKGDNLRMMTLAAQWQGPAEWKAFVDRTPAIDLAQALEQLHPERLAFFEMIQHLPNAAKQQYLLTNFTTLHDWLGLSEATVNELPASAPRPFLQWFIEHVEDAELRERAQRRLTSDDKHFEETVLQQVRNSLKYSGGGAIIEAIRKCRFDNETVLDLRQSPGMALPLNAIFPWITHLEYLYADGNKFNAVTARDGPNQTAQPAGLQNLGKLTRLKEVRLENCGMMAMPALQGLPKDCLIRLGANPYVNTALAALQKKDDYPSLLLVTRAALVTEFVATKLKKWLDDARTTYGREEFRPYQKAHRIITDYLDTPAASLNLSAINTVPDGLLPLLALVATDQLQELILSHQPDLAAVSTPAPLDLSGLRHAAQLRTLRITGNPRAIIIGFDALNRLNHLKEVSFDQPQLALQSIAGFFSPHIGTSLTQLALKSVGFKGDIDLSFLRYTQVLNDLDLTDNPIANILGLSDRNNQDPPLCITVDANTLSKTAEINIDYLNQFLSGLTIDRGDKLTREPRKAIDYDRHSVESYEKSPAAKQVMSRTVKRKRRRDTQKAPHIGDAWKDILELIESQDKMRHLRKQVLGNLAVVRYYHYFRLTVKATLTAALALRPTVGRPDVKAEMKTIERTLLDTTLRVLGIVPAPIVQAYASVLKTGLAELNANEFNAFNRAMSELINTRDIDAFADAVALTATIAMADQLEARQTEKLSATTKARTLVMSTITGKSNVTLQATIDEERAATDASSVLASLQKQQMAWNAAVDAANEQWNAKMPAIAPLPPAKLMAAAKAVATSPEAFKQWAEHQIATGTFAEAVDLAVQSISQPLAQHNTAMLAMEAIRLFCDAQKLTWVGHEHLAVYSPPVVEKLERFVDNIEEMFHQLFPLSANPSIGDGLASADAQMPALYEDRAAAMAAHRSFFDSLHHIPEENFFNQPALGSGVDTVNELQERILDCLVSHQPVLDFSGLDIFHLPDGLDAIIPHITELKLTGTNLTLHGVINELEKFPHLRTLRIAAPVPSDAAPAASETGTPPETIDVSPLQRLPALRTIDFSGRAVADVKGLSELVDKKPGLVVKLDWDTLSPLARIEIDCLRRFEPNITFDLGANAPPLSDKEQRRRETQWALGSASAELRAPWADILHLIDKQNRARFLKDAIESDPALAHYHRYFYMAVLSALKASQALYPVPNRADVKANPNTFGRVVSQAADFMAICPDIAVKAVAGVVKRVVEAHAGKRFNEINLGLAGLIDPSDIEAFSESLALMATLSMAPTLHERQAQLARTDDGKVGPPPETVPAADAAELLMAMVDNDAEWAKEIEALKTDVMIKAGDRDDLSLDATRAQACVIEQTGKNRKALKEWREKNFDGKDIGEFVTIMQSMIDKEDASQKWRLSDAEMQVKEGMRLFCEEKKQVPLKPHFLAHNSPAAERSERIIDRFESIFAYVENVPDDLIGKPPSLSGDSDETIAAEALAITAAQDSFFAEELSDTALQSVNPNGQRSKIIAAMIGSRKAPFCLDLSGIGLGPNQQKIVEAIIGLTPYVKEIIFGTRKTASERATTAIALPAALLRNQVECSPELMNALQKLKHLESLQWCDNGLTDELDLKTFRELRHLKTLDLRGNTFMDVDMASLFDDAIDTQAVPEMDEAARMTVRLTDDGQMSDPKLFAIQYLNRFEPTPRIIFEGGTGEVSLASSRFSHVIALEDRAALSTDARTERRWRDQPRIKKKPVELQAPWNDMLRLIDKQNRASHIKRYIEKRPQLAEYCHHYATTAKAMLKGSVALRAVPGRSDITAEPADGKRLVASIVAELVGLAPEPIVKGIAKAAQVGLAMENQARFTKRNRQLSELVEPDHIDAFCDSLALFATLSKADDLLNTADSKKASRLKRGYTTLKGVVRGKSAATVDEALAKQSAAEDASNLLVALAEAHQAELKQDWKASVTMVIEKIEARRTADPRKKLPLALSDPNVVMNVIQRIANELPGVDGPEGFQKWALPELDNTFDAFVERAERAMTNVDQPAHYSKTELLVKKGAQIFCEQVKVPFNPYFPVFMIPVADKLDRSIDNLEAMANYVREKRVLKIASATPKQDKDAKILKLSGNRPLASPAKPVPPAQKSTAFGLDLSSSISPRDDADLSSILAKPGFLRYGQTSLNCLQLAFNHLFDQETAGAIGLTQGVWYDFLRDNMENTLALPGVAGPDGAIDRAGVNSLLDDARFQGFRDDAGNFQLAQLRKLRHWMGTANKTTLGAEDRPAFLKWAVETGAEFGDLREWLARNDGKIQVHYEQRFSRPFVFHELSGLDVTDPAVAQCFDAKRQDYPAGMIIFKSHAFDALQGSSADQQLEMVGGSVGHFLTLKWDGRGDAWIVDGLTQEETRMDPSVYFEQRGITMISCYVFDRPGDPITRRVNIDDRLQTFARQTLETATGAAIDAFDLLDAVPPDHDLNRDGVNGDLLVAIVENLKQTKPETYGALVEVMLIPVKTIALNTQAANEQEAKRAFLNALTAALTDAGNTTGTDRMVLSGISMKPYCLALHNENGQWVAPAGTELPVRGLTRTGKPTIDYVACTRNIPIGEVFSKHLFPAHKHRSEEATDAPPFTPVQLCKVSSPLIATRMKTREQKASASTKVTL